MNVLGEGGVVVLLQINYTCAPRCYAYVVPIERLGHVLLVCDLRKSEHYWERYEHKCNISVMKTVEYFH